MILYNVSCYIGRLFASIKYQLKLSKNIFRRIEYSEYIIEEIIQLFLLKNLI